MQVLRDLSVVFDDYIVNDWMICLPDLLDELRIVELAVIANDQ